MTTWRCAEGHEWLAKYNTIQQGKGCPICAGVAKVTPEQYYHLAKIRGIEWIGTFPPNSSTPTQWRCPHGHAWMTAYSTIKRGRGCPKCAGVAKVQASDYINLANARTFKWIGKLPQSIKSPTRWRCLKGHEWDASYASLRHGNGCPHCSGMIRKTSGHYTRLATECELEWIGELPKNVDHKTRWRGRCGHEWDASYKKIRLGRGCPFCANNRPKEIGDYVQLANERGFKFVGEFPANTHASTEWQCQKQHIWRAAYTDILQGTGCPLCQNIVNGSPVSSPQRTIYEILGGTLNYREGRYTIDVALEICGVKVAIEYDGWYWHKGREAHDSKRDAILLNRGWRVLRVKSGEKIPDHQQLGIAIALLLSGKRYTEIILDDWIGEQDGGD